MTFAHLHVASGFSLRHGTTTPEDLVARAAELGQPALAQPLLPDRLDLGAQGLGDAREGQGRQLEGGRAGLGDGRAAAGPSSREPKLPWPSTSGSRMEKGWARRTRAS